MRDHTQNFSFFSFLFQLVGDVVVVLAKTEKKEAVARTGEIA